MNLKNTEVKKFLNMTKHKKLLTHTLGIYFLLSALIHDPQNLPKGWDMPKVWAYQIFTITFTLITLGVLLQTTRKKFKLKSYATPKTIAILLYPITALLLPLITSPYYVNLSKSNYRSPIYMIFNNTETVPIHLVGNQFRDQGLITLGLLILLGYICYMISNRANFNTLIKYLFATGIIQALIGITQFVAHSIDKKHFMYTEPFGAFGQSNFYAGILFFGLISATYLGLTRLISKKTALASAILITFGILITTSTWVKILLTLSFLILLTKLIAGRTITKLPRIIQIRNLFYISTILAILIIPFNAYVLSNHYTGFEQRGYIWKEVVDIYIKKPLVGEANISKLLTGSGFDTLGYEIVKTGTFSDLYIDRAHNFLLEIVVSTGMFGLMIFLSLWFYLISRINGESTKEFKFAITLLMSWLWVSSAHTSSIVSLALFFIILGMATKLKSTVTSSQQSQYPEA